MAKKRGDLRDERGAIVLAPQPVRRGCFAVLVPADMKWEVRGVAGGYRLDFRPMTPEERARRHHDGEQP
jgi:hypothetical protein